MVVDDRDVGGGDRAVAIEIGRGVATTDLANANGDIGRVDEEITVLVGRSHVPGGQDDAIGADRNGGAHDADTTGLDLEGRVAGSVGEGDRLAGGSGTWDDPGTSAEIDHDLRIGHRITHDVSDRDMKREIARRADDEARVHRGMPGIRHGRARRLISDERHRDEEQE